MSKDKSPGSTPPSNQDHDYLTGAPGILDVSRRGALLGGVGLTAAGLGFNVASSSKAAAGFGFDFAPGGHFPDCPKLGKPKDRVLLKGGIVLTMDPAVPDLEKGDVLVEGKKIIAIGANLGSGGGAQVVDCTGKIVMPGFITTHHHQYETIMRSIIADGYITFADNPIQPEQQSTDWQYEAYTTVVQNIWTSGRIIQGGTTLWDLGAPPMHPEDCYLAELVASLAEISMGITCSTDTSQASHTPAHTDAMIKGLMDSGARALYDYSGGINRSGNTTPNSAYEYPGISGNTTLGVGRLRNQYFSSEDQLVTLGLAAGAGAAFTGAPYTGWALAKEFGTWINNHNVGSPTTITANVSQLSDPAIGNRMTQVHCVRWQDAPVAQIGAVKSGDTVWGFPNDTTSQAWKIFHDTGGHASIAVAIEQQMRHGMPPIQSALNHGILPSLSPDVDSNMTPDPFSLMRSAFCIQRALANDLAFNLSDPGKILAPQTVTTRQVLEMATVAGAAGSGLANKVGSLTVGKEADIVFLETMSIDIQPMNNAPGTVVTMMDTSHVRHVMIAGKFVYWNYQLVGWNVEKLVNDVMKTRDKVLQRIRAVPLPAPGFLNSQNSPYRASFLDSCCIKGQNLIAPPYVVRP
jgi:5-methylthioadenosine/S-adenosylhomocysteine deaminase